MRPSPIIHIGYSKAASTWLQERFRDLSGCINYYHKPRLWYHRDNKIIWDNARLVQLARQGCSRSLPFVLSHEHLILPEIHPVLGCSTTNLGAVKEMSCFLAEQLEAPRIILIIRKQTSLIASRYLQYIVQGGRLRIDEFLSKLLPQNEPELFCDYRFSLVLDSLEDVFGKTNIFVATVEDIRKDTALFLRNCFEFIGCKPNNAMLKSKVKNRSNVGLSKYGASAARRWNSLVVSEKENVENRSQTKIPYKGWLLLLVVMRKIDGFFYRKRRRPGVLDKEHEKVISNIFRKDNSKLALRFPCVLDW